MNSNDMGVEEMITKQILLSKIPLKATPHLLNKSRRLFRKLGIFLGFCMPSKEVHARAHRTLFSKLLNEARSPFFDEMNARIALWQEIVGTDQVKIVPSRKAGVRGVAYLICRQGKPILKIEFRYWLQESEANLAVFFEAKPENLDALLFFESKPAHCCPIVPYPSNAIDFQNRKCPCCFFFKSNLFSMT